MTPEPTPVEPESLPPPAGEPTDDPVDGPSAPPEVSKSFLVQKFARLGFDQYSVIGYSVAGEETVIQIPELNVCFDIGRAPYFALSSDYVCISHGHMDHLAGLAYYISQRYFQGMKPGTVILPRELMNPVETMLRTWQGIERQNTPYELIPMSDGQMYEIRKDFGVRCFNTHHGGVSLGYSLVSIREKLKPEYHGRTGPELAQLRKDGVNIQYRLEVPLVAFLGDTAIGPVFDHPDVQNASILITECTFFDPAHKAKAKAGKHLHLDQLASVLPNLRNEHIIIGHVSRRLGVRRARQLLKKKIGPEAMKRIHFLMDFQHSTDAGDMEDAGPAPAED